MSRRPSRRLLWIGLLLVSLAPTAAGKLTADFRALVLRPRPNAPLPVSVTLDWQGAGLLEGRIEIRLADDYRTMLEYRTSKIVQPAGVQTTRWLLPPLREHNTGIQLFAELTFVREGGRNIRLGRFPIGLGTSSRGGRSFVVAHVRDALRRVPQDQRLMQGLWLESFFPPGHGQDNTYVAIQAFRTLSSPLAYADCPRQPLQYCAYDLVLLTGPALARLTSAQHKALGAWLAAGGSLLVAPTGRLTEKHRALLQGWIGAGRATLSLDHTAQLTVKPAPPAGLGRYRVGLGRLLLLPRPASVAPRGPAWREAVAWLWKVRAPILRDLPDHGWRFPARLIGPDAHGGYGHGGTELAGALMPAQTTPVPIWVVMLLLVMFIVAIGPLDYLVLGKLDRRKWTWVTFPLMSLGFTVLTVAIAEGFMGHTDHRRALVVVDLGEGGRVLRTNRLELVLLSRERELALEGKGSLLSKLSGGTEEDRPVTTGRVPIAYRATHRLAKWSPLVYRRFQIGGEAPALKLRWDRIDPSRWKRPAPLSRIPGLLLGDARPKNLLSIRVRRGSLDKELWRGTAQRGGISELPELAHVNDGTFSLLYGLSPEGGQDLADVAVFDRTDPSQWLISVTYRQGDDRVVLRRVYHVEERR